MLLYIYPVWHFNFKQLIKLLDSFTWHFNHSYSVFILETHQRLSFTEETVH